ncbi:metallophosphoesterase family protein [Chitinophaga rhizosphaerae]|uniref:metallophosphoesterase family protein n=1 Tax=Chitinophaga rhizosphaerae TaxID=1864947 RepID=UPI000F7FE0D5|nr:metallophosphoesterase family protein [Chitinophaga rhizosphaerae]
MSRTFAIGDIHGAYRALQQIIERIGPKTGDRLVFLGDYVDGWSESAETIAYMMELEQRYDCIFLRGNHDAWCESWLGGEPALDLWLQHGGMATVASYEKLSPEKRLQHLAFFRRMRQFYTDEHNRLYIHAGFASMHGPEFERYQYNYMWDRTLWEMALSLNPKLKTTDLQYPKRLRLFHEIIIGHTPTTNYGEFRPMHAGNVWNVDTGAGFAGKLSALELRSKDCTQSDTVLYLYPGEKGRNP